LSNPAFAWASERPEQLPRREPQARLHPWELQPARVLRRELLLPQEAALQARHPGPLELLLVLPAVRRRELFLALGLMAPRGPSSRASRQWPRALSSCGVSTYLL